MWNSTLFSDRITDVQVTAPNNPAIEGFPYMLKCKVTGPADYVHWMMNGHFVPGDNTTDILMNNTIYFNPVEPIDTGNYQCIAMNAAENMTSPPYMLLVNCEYNIYKIYFTVNHTL